VSSPNKGRASDRVVRIHLKGVKKKGIGWEGRRKNSEDFTPKEGKKKMKKVVGKEKRKVTRETKKKTSAGGLTPYTGGGDDWKR